MSKQEWEIVARTNDRLGESPLWRPEERRLYWIDFYGPSVHRLDPATGQVETWKIPGAEWIGSLVGAGDGRLLLALDRRIVLFDPRTTAVTLFADPNEGRPGLSYNDSKVDRSGHYWIGNFDASETEPRAIFYRVAADGTYKVADSGFIVCNGPAFSPDGTVLYFSDTVGRRILAYDVDRESGRLDNRRLFASIDGMPDGLTVDCEGQIWCAVYNTGLIMRFRPDGTCAETIEVPAKYVTSCCLGGDDLRTLYVTTGLDPSGPASDLGGCLLARRVECAGLPELQFTSVEG